MCRRYGALSTDQRGEFIWVSVGGVASAARESAGVYHDRKGRRHGR